jgi:hypothetical protein
MRPVRESITNNRLTRPAGLRDFRRYTMAVLWSFLVFSAAQAQDTVCARVKIEIKQELTLERQAFDAEMKINNTTDSGVIENVSVVIRVTDENGVPVPVTDNPNDLSAKFFVRLSSKENIDNVDGTGAVNPKTTSIIDWVLIPAPGAAGSSPLGKKYLVGATLKYKFGAEDSVLEVSPDVITVKPLPLLTLDYFLTREVEADDPLTPEIEPTQPFTLGVRVKNNGIATAKDLKIDSAQPKIVENKQGLLINFTLTGSYINDAPVQNSLLANFGDIPGNTSKMGRWTMETTLAGKFTEFTARFTHSDELGGALTSLLQATNAHFLLRDVRVDLPGRDYVRDFLAADGDVIRVYESEGADTEVTDRSVVARLNLTGTGNYHLSFPPTAGFAYAKLTDPFNGTKMLGSIVRADAKQLAPENVWLSRTRNEQSKQWEYWVNFFDVNTSGEYETRFDAPPAAAAPPVLQFIPDRTVQEGKQVSFIVEASSAEGKPLTISAAPLPVGASLTARAPSAQSPGLAQAVFDWTPAKGTAGNYPIRFSASDGVQNAARMASIKVETESLPAGPGTPTIVAPLSGAILYKLRPALSVLASATVGDPGAQVQFELYADEAATQLVASTVMDKAVAAVDASGAAVPMPTIWSVPTDLDYDKPYWWRARVFDGTVYSTWARGRFLVTSLSAPSVFNLTSPAPDVQVSTLTPTLAWTNSRTADGEPVSYTVSVYKNSAMTELAAETGNIAESATGTTSWTVTPALLDATKYYWRVVARRASGAQKSATSRAFTVNVANTAPSAPALLSPAANGVSGVTSPTLMAGNSMDAENDLLTYVFEIDRVSTFDSPARRTSGQVMASTSGASWQAPALEQNGRYWWRVKAQDARAESAWSVGQFLVSTDNDAPPVPTIANPGNGAWTPGQQPSLQVNPVKDPEGEAVSYGFEVYRDAALTQKISEGTSATTAMIVPAQLGDKAWYWWRVRAIDSRHLASDWSAPAALYVNSGTPTVPSIALVAPSSTMVPVSVDTAEGARRQVTIRWEGIDPTSAPTVGLYYGTAKTGYTGTPIVEGLHAAAGTEGGSYVWDTSALAPGAYRVYAVAFDSRGVGKAYAPGSVVIPNATPSGTLIMAGPGNWYEAGVGTVAAEWTKAAGVPMIIPLSGSAIMPTRQQYLDEQAPNARASRLIGEIYPYQCSTDARMFAPQAGPIITEDLDFAGRIAVASDGKLASTALNTNDASMRICDISVLSEVPLSATSSSFTVTARLSNLGAGVLSAKVMPLAPPGIAVTGNFVFGVIGAGETGTPQGTVTVRAQPGSIGVSSIQRSLRWLATPVR